jgi:hypothetical protein
MIRCSRTRTGRWARRHAGQTAETLGLTDTLRAIPITDPEAVQTIGLVVPARADDAEHRRAGRGSAPSQRHSTATATSSTKF